MPCYQQARSQTTKDNPRYSVLSAKAKALKRRFVFCYAQSVKNIGGEIINIFEFRDGNYYYLYKKQQYSSKIHNNKNNVWLMRLRNKSPQQTELHKRQNLHTVS